MKNRQNVLKSTKVTEQLEPSSASEDISRKSKMQHTKMMKMKQKSGSTAANRFVPKGSIIHSTRATRSVETAVPQLYKTVHNIGRRKAAEHVVSYKETEIAVCFKDSYWPNAKLDLSNAMRTESVQVKSVAEKMNDSTTESKTEHQVLGEKVKLEKSSRCKAESRLDTSSTSHKTTTPAQLPSNKSNLDNQKATNRKSSPMLKHSSRFSDDGVEKSGNKEVEALLQTASSSSVGKNDEDDLSTKNQIRLSSKKRAELSFLALGLSNSIGADSLTEKPKTGDQQQQYVRARRTASLNAGAIVSLMLQKEDSVAKKTKLHLDDDGGGGDDDDSDDDDDDDSSSSSSESGESTFSEYSAPGESKQLKKSKLNSSETLMTSSVGKAVSPNESSKEKLHLVRKSVMTTEPEAVQRKIPAMKHVVKPSEDSAGFLFENSGSPLRRTVFPSDAALGSKDSSAIESGEEITKTKKFAFSSASLKNSLPNVQATENEVREARGKRKRREFQDSIPEIIPPKRMASLNAQAILAASRDERTKRSRGNEAPNKLSESPIKSRSSLTDRCQMTSETAVQSQSKSPKKSGGDCDKMLSFGGKVQASGNSHHSTKSSFALRTSDGQTVDSTALSTSNKQCRTLDRVPFAGTYVELVSPPTSIQLVEMTSTPVLTPNKTYQQLDRPQNNCQQFSSSDRQLAPAWSDNPYTITQFPELHSSNGHPSEFHKNSSDRPPAEPASNVITALIPHATSLAPTVPIRFTAHLVPQNPLPQPGFYGQLQPYPPFYSDRFPYGRPNLFSYPAKAFNSSGCFTSRHIPTDLYNASRHLQVYEVQTARPVYGRQSDFNLQLCQPQFIGSFASHTEGREQLQQLYRPYLSPSAHQPFPHTLSQTMCAPSYGPSQAQVALAVSEVSPPASEKPSNTVSDSCQGTAVSDEKLLKMSPSDGQPKLTDISYSVVKRTNQPSRRKQVETKHSSTQVKSREVVSGSLVANEDRVGLEQQEKSNPENIKPKSGRLPNDTMTTRKTEESSNCEVNKTNFSSCQMMSTPPALCQAFLSKNQSTESVDVLCCSYLSSCSAKNKPCVADETRQHEGERIAKQEDFKPTVSGKVVKDLKSVADIKEPFIPYSKTDRGNRVLHYQSLPLTNLPCGKSGSRRSWSRDISQDGHQQKIAEAQGSVIDLSLDKELDLSRKKKTVEPPPNTLISTSPLKKKKSSPTAMTLMSESARCNSSPLHHKSLNLVPNSCVLSEHSADKGGEDVIKTSSKSCLGQLHNVVAIHSKEIPVSVASETSVEWNNKSVGELTAVTAQQQMASAVDASTLTSNDCNSIAIVSCKETKNELTDRAGVSIGDDGEASALALDLVATDSSNAKRSSVELMRDCVVIDLCTEDEESNDKVNEGINSPDCWVTVEESKAAAKPELSQMEVVADLTSDLLMNKSKSVRPTEIKTDELSIVSEKANWPEAAVKGVHGEKAGNAENAKTVTSASTIAINKNPREIHERSFRGSVPMKRIESSTKFTKRINTVGFGNRNACDKGRRKSMDAVKRSRSNSASISAANRKPTKSKTSVTDLNARKDKKDVTFQGKIKKRMNVESTLKKKISSDNENGIRGDEEMYKRKEDAVKRWKWKEPGTMKLVCTEVDGQAVHQMCYPAIEHTNGDVIRVRDCVFVRSGMRKKDKPYIAKIYAFWPLQETGEMMMGVFWYYRHHQSDSEHLSKYLNNEVFASRHRDVIPVACIEDRCFVLTLNEFCRYKAEQKRIECNLPKRQSLVPVAVDPCGRLPFQPPSDADPDTVFLCRNVYDIKLRRISKHPRKLQS